MMKYIISMIYVVMSVMSNGQTLTNIEAVEYDPSQNRFFISNGSSIVQRASNGDMSFFGEASATHGMEVMGDYLFVIDSNVIRAYLLTTAEEVMTLSIPGVSFLNGMANDGVSLIWVTDFGGEKIYEIDVSDLDDPIALEVVNDTESTPNGIVYDYLQNRLVFVTWGSNADIIEVDPITYEMTVLEETSLGNLDGIDMSMQGNFFVSSWTPNRITQYNSNFSSSETLPILGLNNPADISYADATDTLGIPNSGNETVFYYSESAVSVEELDYFEKLIDLKVVPNPVTSTAEIRFNLERPATVGILIYDSLGHLSRIACDGYFFEGNHSVNLDRSGLDSGNYIIQVDINGRILKTQLIFE